jgi:hypothetical protein
MMVGDQTLKARQTKSICAGTMKLGQNLCQTHTNTQKKYQVPAIFRDIAIRILVKVHFCESKLYKAKKCALLKIV